MVDTILQANDLETLPWPSNNDSPRLKAGVVNMARPWGQTLRSRSYVERQVWVEADVGVLPQPPPE